MTDKEKELLKSAIEEADSELNNEFLKNAEIPELDKKFKYVDLYENSAKQKPVSKLRRILIMAASFVVVFGLAAAVTFSPAFGFKQSISEFIKDLRHPTHENIGVYSDENEKKLKEYQGNYIPTLIPEGYYVEEVSSTDMCKSIIMRDEHYYLSFLEYNNYNNLNVDNEDIIRKENCNYNGNDAVKYYKKDKIEVSIILDDTLLVVVYTDENLNIDRFMNCIEKIS